MLAEAIRHADEGDTIAGKDRAEGHQPRLGLPATAFAVLGTTEGLDQGRYVREVDGRTVNRQHAKEVFPEHAGRKALLVSLVQSAPEGFPEAPGEPGPRLTESLFGDTFVAQPGAEHPDMAPGRAEPLRHGLAVKSNEHHEPGDDFGDQVSPSFRSRTGLLGNRLEFVRGNDVAKRRQTERSHQGSSRRLVRADTRHEKASLHEPDRDGHP